MTNQNDIFATKAGQWDFVIAISVIALMGFFIYMVAFKKKPEQKTQIEKSIDVKNREKEVETTVLAANTVATKSNREKEVPYRISKVKRTNALDGNDQAEASILTDYEVSEISTVESVDSASEQNIVDSETAQDHFQTLATELDKSTQVVETEATIVEEDEQVSQQKDTSPPPTGEKKVAGKTVVNQNSPCSVIVGSFQDPKNIARVVNKLKEMGQEIVQGQTRPGLNYVGVPVDCSDMKAQEDLVLILNQTFDIKAWVKKPQ